MTELDIKILRVAETTRAIWAIVTVVSFIYMVIYQPLWWLIPFAIGAVVSYFGSLMLVGFLMGFFVEKSVIEEGLQADRIKEINELSADGTLPDGEKLDNLIHDAGFTFGEVVAAGEVFGRYMDVEMHEWLDLTGKDGKPVRYIYENVAQRDAKGNPFLPTTEGLALLKGILYKKAST
jgi:hypothetical protein